MDILNSINWDYIYALLLVVVLFSTKIWLVPFLRTKGIGKKYYNMLEEALLLGNMMFRSEKTNKIFQICFSIVSTLETLDSLTSEEKHIEATTKLAEILLNEMNIVLDGNTLDRIVMIVVAFMGDL